MMEPTTNQFVLGQRYTFATLALVVGLLSFLNLAGMEKAVLAIVLGMRALSLQPEPALQQRRGWAKSAIALGTAQIVLLATIILLNLDRLARVGEVLEALSYLR
jgi:uncharacterized membrane protein YadS